LEIAIVVANALAQVEVTLLAVPLAIEEGSTENSRFAVGLDREVNILSGVSEALSVPEEVALVYEVS
tara:strand:- start:39657 stop:39857 length:201 start_codon:yes stop_codon:yes gene_type:complete